MTTAAAEREEILLRLLETFRQRGYDGASLSDLSQVTGLGRSSLYHYFPGGKEDMALRVLDLTEAWLRREIVEPLQGPGSPQQRLAAMARRLDGFYGGGTKGCLLERLSASVDRQLFRTQLARCFQAWIAGLAQLAQEAGVAPRAAQSRAQDVVLRLEGALVVATALADGSPFQRVLAELPQTLLQGATAQRPRRRPRRRARVKEQG